MPVVVHAHGRGEFEADAARTDKPEDRGAPDVALEQQQRVLVWKPGEMARNYETAGLVRKRRVNSRDGLSTCELGWVASTGSATASGGWSLLAEAATAARLQFDEPDGLSDRKSPVGHRKIRRTADIM